ncbi:hypothetical protein M885DRAFT_296599 [Pelagophyceae sp. CCMP2097]|nr:hypothetical protein M885DRAFT_296599 [Pelagophyceae sp. CCMP2097]
MRSYGPSQGLGVPKALGPLRGASMKMDGPSQDPVWTAPRKAPLTGRGKPLLQGRGPCEAHRFLKTLLWSSRESERSVSSERPRGGSWDIFGARPLARRGSEARRLAPARTPGRPLAKVPRTVFPRPHALLCAFAASSTAPRTGPRASLDARSPARPSPLPLATRQGPTQRAHARLLVRARTRIGPIEPYGVSFEISFGISYKAQISQRMRTPEQERVRVCPKPAGLTVAQTRKSFDKPATQGFGTNCKPENTVPARHQVFDSTDPCKASLAATRPVSVRSLNRPLGRPLSRALPPDGPCKASFVATCTVSARSLARALPRALEEPSGRAPASASFVATCKAECAVTCEAFFKTP